MHRPDLGVLEVYDIVVRHNLGVIGERFIVIQLGPSQVMLAQNLLPLGEGLLGEGLPHDGNQYLVVFLGALRVGIEAGVEFQVFAFQDLAEVCQSRLSWRKPRQSHPPSLAW